jgi:hypothetical protein
MMLDYSKIYTDYEDYLSLKGSARMKMTPDAAKALIKIAADLGEQIMRVEGGRFSPGRFEARLTAIWDGDLEASGLEEMKSSNLSAVRFIDIELHDCNAFIVTSRRFIPKVRADGGD